MLRIASARWAAPLQVGMATVKTWARLDGPPRDLSRPQCSAVARFAQSTQGFPGVRSPTNARRSRRTGPRRYRYSPCRASFKSGRIDCGVEHSLAGPLVAAARTRALGSEREIRKPVNPRLGPGHFQDLFGLKGTDVRGRIGHGLIQRGDRLMTSGQLAQYGS